MRHVVYLIISNLLIISSLLGGCSSSTQPQNNANIPQKVEIKLASQDNLKDWNVQLSPMYNAAIKKWVFNMKVEYIGKKAVQDVTLELGDSVTKIAQLEPLKSFGSRGDWIPENISSIDLKLEWRVGNEQSEAKATYSIKKDTNN